MDQNHKRNFCIIAHIDHGKSTLADRLLERTGVVDKRHQRDQILDTMDLERERGITIKLQPARMPYQAQDGHAYELNLIDTPGHVDFTYEVSRSLAAVEGALLLVDATQGVQAQTIANLYLAMEQNVVIIPVLNKVDVTTADVERYGDELIHLLGCRREEIIVASGKTGQGVDEILARIITDVPAPRGVVEAPFRAVIFDSLYDDYQGVVAYVRCVDGVLASRADIHCIATGANGTALELGYLIPKRIAESSMSAGDIGYIITGLKEISSVRVGDTLVQARDADRVQPLPGYQEVCPMMYAGVFSEDGSEYEALRDAIEKLQLNDASLCVEPEHSLALGFGFRCGLLGMLHLEIVQERIEREFGLSVVVTTPSVRYEVTRTDGTVQSVTSPAGFPATSFIQETREPWSCVDIVCPKQALGAVMGLIQDRRGVYRTTEYLDAERAVLHYDMPLANVIVDLYDAIKGATAGYASMNYEPYGYRSAPIVLLQLLVAEEPVEAFAVLVHEDEAYRRGKEIVEILKDALPRQQFVVKIQATVDGRIIAAERISAYRKDVLAKMSGGDYSRKSKLLKKQKRGKERMLAHGKGAVPIPQDVFLRVMRRSS